MKNEDVSHIAAFSQRLLAELIMLESWVGFRETAPNRAKENTSIMSAFELAPNVHNLTIDVFDAIEKIGEILLISLITFFRLA